MKSKMSGLVATVAMVTLCSMMGACSPPPKVLIDAQFLGDTRTAKTLMRRSGKGQFDQFIRICTLQKDGKESQCKDTLVLENVTPGSLY